MADILASYGTSPHRTPTIRFFFHRRAFPAAKRRAFPAATRRAFPAANAVSHTPTADRRFEAHRHTDTPTYGHTAHTRRRTLYLTHTADRRFEAHRHTDTPTYRHTDIQTHRHTDKGLTKGTHGLCAGACAMAWVQRSRMKKNAFATYSTCSNNNVLRLGEARRTEYS